MSLQQCQCDPGLRERNPSRSSSTGFSLCGLSCGALTIHRLKPVLLKPSYAAARFHAASLHRNAYQSIPCEICGLRNTAANCESESESGTSGISCSVRGKLFLRIAWLCCIGKLVDDFSWPRPAHLLARD